MRNKPDYQTFLRGQERGELRFYGVAVGVRGEREMKFLIVVLSDY